MIPSEEILDNESTAYIGLNEANLSSFPILFTEKNEETLDEIEKFCSMPIIDEFFLLQQDQSPAIQETTNDDLHRLLKIVQVQLELDGKSWNCVDDLIKNVFVVGRSGTGKKTIVRRCCQMLWNESLVYPKFVDCLSFKGKKVRLPFGLSLILLFP